jgi:hypothetical protein
MQESKDPKSAVPSEEKASTSAREPGSDATSTDTLEDIEETEASVGSSPATSSTPSPDGSFDEASPDRADGSNTADPM